MLNLFHAASAETIPIIATGKNRQILLDQSNWAKVTKLPVDL